MSDCLSPVIGSAHLCPFASDSDFQALILESSNDGQETEAEWKNQIVLVSLLVNPKAAVWPHKVLRYSLPNRGRNTHRGAASGFKRFSTTFPCFPQNELFSYPASIIAPGRDTTYEDLEEHHRKLTN